MSARPGDELRAIADKLQAEVNRLRLQAGELEAQQTLPPSQRSAIAERMAEAAIAAWYKVRDIEGQRFGWKWNGSPYPPGIRHRLEAACREFLENRLADMDPPL